LRQRAKPEAALDGCDGLAGEIELRAILATGAGGAGNEKTFRLRAAKGGSDASALDAKVKRRIPTGGEPAHPRGRACGMTNDE
jgi:hypothetical protein